MINKVILIGNLGNDPEIRTFSNGNQVVNFALATSETWKDKSGDRQSKTEWHKVAVFGKVAAIVEQHLRKGSKVYVEGKLQTRKWETQDGETRYTTEVVVDFGGQIKFLDKAGATDEPKQQNFDDDIPF